MDSPSGTSGTETDIQVNQALTELLSEGKPSALYFRGFAGPSQDESVVNLYPHMLDLNRSIEIRREDIVLVQSAADAGLSDGSVIIWVREKAKVTHRRVVTAGELVAAEPRGSVTEVNKGRLRMRIHQTEAACRVCYSLCSPPPCHSPPVCQSRGCA